MVSNLALFCLATVLATFKKIGHFFPNHLVPLASIRLSQRVDRINKLFLAPFSLSGNQRYKTFLTVIYKVGGTPAYFVNCSQKN
jgi:hypothetical protein